METLAWTLLDGYSIESQLNADGLSFSAFDIVTKTFKMTGAEKLRGKVVGRLGSELRQEYREQNGDKDINLVTGGCYSISLGGAFQVRYSDVFNSRVVYIGSGNVFGRLKGHLKGKLFDFAGAIRGVPLRFHVADLKETDVSHKDLEQALLNKFLTESGGSLPLMNKINAKADVKTKGWPKGWDKPLHKDKGQQIAKWLIQPVSFDAWKGVLDKGVSD
ncbi:MAG: hypothetical protein Q8Q63_03770 [Phaeovulum sp.]|uniref:hypothetical protein n=1 Tax=Phaeovulum sp. TaxID=2934796 RepID=UPI002736BB81|nr:hypothetical protein [Phaeovulum sp.]MDP3860684.1 hypothetical protein [Phaeovulum sp.]